MSEPKKRLERWQRWLARETRCQHEWDQQRGRRAAEIAEAIKRQGINTSGTSMQRGRRAVESFMCLDATHNACTCTSAIQPQHLLTLAP